MDKTSSEIVVELVNNFTEFMFELDPKWKKAYYRFNIDENHYGSSSSYEDSENIEIIGTIKNSEFFRKMNKISEKLFLTLKEKKGVFLLTVDSSLSYKIDFDWDNQNRWEISKIDGKSGRPEDG